MKTNVDLKWVKVQPLPKDGKKFRATATLDVDEMTNNIRLQMANAKEKIAKYEADGRAALEASRYDEAIRMLTAAEALIEPYSALKSELAQVFTLNESFNLKHNLPGLRADIASKLGNLQVKTAPEKLVLEKDVIENLTVTVTDAKGAVTDFPLKAVQDGKKLDSRRTQDNGTAVFTIPNVNFGAGTLAISFVPDFPKDILKTARLEKGFVVPYEVKQASCNVRFDCTGSPEGCKALADQMAKQGVLVGKNAKDPVIKAEVKATPKGSLNQLLSFDVMVSVSGDKVSFTKSSKGVGKTEAEAVAKAVGKLKVKEFDKVCK